MTNDPQALLLQLSVEEFTDRLASREPAPGGGSAAALSGLLGVSLLEMVVHLSLGRAELAAQQDLLLWQQTQLAGLHRILKGLIDRDAAAFRAVIAAFKLPKETEGEKALRTETLQNAFREAAAVPLETAETCLAVLESGETLVGRVNAHAVSDLAVGALSAHTGVVGALLNTAINLPAIQDKLHATVLDNRIRQLKQAADEKVQSLQRLIYAGDPFGRLANKNRRKP